LAVAGLLIGNMGGAEAMGGEVRRHLFHFWDVIDQILNAALFLLIGLEGIALLGDPRLLLGGLIALPVSLLARLVSIAVPLVVWRRLLPLKQAFPLLTWGGLRGGLSVAMALSIPQTPYKDAILAATYVVVMFSVVVQGSTVEALIRRTIPARPASSW
jgi:CPA1 family monovalent cation:H+ antiporter